LHRIRGAENTQWLDEEKNTDRPRKKGEGEREGEREKENIYTEKRTVYFVV